MKLGLGVALGLALAPAVAAAQSLVIAPTAVILRSPASSTALTLVSQDSVPLEVTVSTTYGYPVSDTAGHVTVRTIETPDDTMPNAAAWVAAYPRRLVLEPGTRRTVRLVATPPPGLPPGEYWGRVIVAARGHSVALPTADGLDARLDVEIRSVIGLFYRKGPLTTGVTASEVIAEREGDSVVVRPTLARQGPAAFVGTVRAELRDGTGAVRGSAIMPLGVYYTLAPRLAIPAGGLPPGEYRVTVLAEAVRPDLPSSQLTPAAPFRIERTLALP